MKNSEEILKILELIGLTAKERAVYIALLTNGPSTAHAIARHSHVTRTHVYDIAESLFERGLLNVSKGSGAKKYDALDHAGLTAYLSRKAAHIKELQQQLAESESLFNELRDERSQRTRIRFYEGHEGMNQAYADIKADLLNAKGSKEMYTYMPVVRLERAIPDIYKPTPFFNIPGLIKRDILYDSPAAQKYIDVYKKSVVTYAYRRWPAERGEFPCDVLVWGSKLVLTDLRGAPAGIVVDNQSLADTVRMWFEALWTSLPEPS